MRASFIELRAHSAFSFGAAAVTPETLVRRAAELGYSTLGITDAADLRRRRPVRCSRPGARASGPSSARSCWVEVHPAAFLAMNSTAARNLAGLVTHARVGPGSAWHLDPRASPHRAWARGRALEPGRRAERGADLAHRPRLGQTRDARPRRAPGTTPGACCISGATSSANVWPSRCTATTGGDEAALAGALIALAEQAGVPWVVAQIRAISIGGRLVHDMLTALRHGADARPAAARGLCHPNGDWRLLAPDEMAAPVARRATRDSRRAPRSLRACGFDLAGCARRCPATPCRRPQRRLVPARRALRGRARTLGRFAPSSSAGRSITSWPSSAGSGLPASSS